MYALAFPFFWLISSFHIRDIINEVECFFKCCIHISTDINKIVGDVWIKSWQTCGKLVVLE
jgi:hypothetical protein